jgi:hypothetical protein
MICEIPFFKDDITWFEIISTVVLPVVLFLSGYWLGRFLEKIKENRRKKRLKKYFKQLIIQLSEKLKKQIIEINLAKERQDDFTSKDLMAIRIAGESHKLLKSINREELFEIIVEKEKHNTRLKTKLFDDLMSKIDFINEALNAFETNILSIPKNYSIYENLWNESHFKLIKYFNLIVSTSNTSKGQDVLLDKFSEILDDVNKLKNDKPYIENIQLAYHRVIEPMNKILLSVNNDIRTVELMDLVQKSKLGYMGMLDYRERNKVYYVMLSSQLEKVKNEILELSEQI